MSQHDVYRFRLFPLRVGNKIHIDGGNLRGDWEVVGVGDRKVRLRCPVSGREVERDLFHAFVSLQKGVEWPEHDE
ncbi:MAG: hypothetical protein AB9873_08160 [Syntrophobacteraceae bacterium]